MVPNLVKLQQGHLQFCKGFLFLKNKILNEKNIKKNS